MDFSNYTLEQMDALDPKARKNFSKKDYHSYLKRNKELGRPYEVGGKQTFFEPGEPFYACGAKSLEKDEKGNWRISVVALGPGFEEYPIAVDEETFIETMLEVGVPKEKIDEFIAYEVGWDEF